MDQVLGNRLLRAVDEDRVDAGVSVRGIYRPAADDKVMPTVVRAGYPEPEEVTFSPAPMIEGAPHRPRNGTLPAGRPHRPMVHARITFGERVVGPVLVGSMRYFGLGLLVPAVEG